MAPIALISGGAARAAAAGAMMNYDPDDIWTRRPQTIRRKHVGKSIVYVDRYFVAREPRFYIEANGPDYRIWKRVPRDEYRAIEIYQSYRFWVWFIEAFDTLTTTRFITWLMQKLV